jgi:hypothetical protein
MGRTGTTGFTGTDHAELVELEEYRGAVGHLGEGPKLLLSPRGRRGQASPMAITSNGTSIHSYLYHLRRNLA